MPNKKVEDFLYEELTYKVRGAMYKVHKALGSGHKESVYHRAQAKELDFQNITYETEKSLPVIYEEINVGTYKPDFIVEDKVIIELKALSFLSKQAISQIYYYLKGTDYKLGLLANFGTNSLSIKRVVWDKGRRGQSFSSNQRIT